jgi:hypothetical protein
MSGMVRHEANEIATLQTTMHLIDVVPEEVSAAAPL